MTRSKKRGPRRFSLHAALEYAAEHWHGYNEKANGRERSQRGNPDGAARLCRWAFDREAGRR